MKTLLLVASLMVLASCGGSGSSSKDGSPSGADGLRSHKSITAQAEARISIHPEYYEVLSNGYDRQTNTFNGKSYECDAMAYAGDIVGYLVVKDELLLIKDGVQMLLKRVSGDSGQLSGSWTHDEKDKAGSYKTDITFSSNKISFTVKCDFK